MTTNALRTLLPIAGWTEARAREVEFTGGSDPILPTPFKIGETSAAAIAAIGLAVCDLWEARTGRRQTVAVDARQAAASLRGQRYLRTEKGIDAANAPRGISGIYPAKNGRWSYLHCGWPNHRDAVLRALKVPDDREAVRQAIARWEALELEEAMIREGGAGGMVRSMAEWAAHPQSAAVASLPLLEIIKIGDSRPEKLPDGGRPLSGLRVLDLTRAIAGPICGRSLAEHGADVLRINAAHLPNTDYDAAIGKLSAYLDLRNPQEVETLRGLAHESDIFVQSYRPGTLGDRGFSPQTVAQLRPGIIFVSMSAFSHAGPWASRRGFDTVVQAMSGIAVRQTEVFPGPTPAPVFYPVSAIDYLTGHLLAFGALVALARRVREGGSWLVRNSLAQTGRWIVERGEVPTATLKDVPAEFTPAELERWTTAMDTPQGRQHHLAPVVRLSETPARWARPWVPLGYNDPVWPARTS